MSYEPLNQNDIDILNAQEQKTYENLRTCNLVKDVIDSEGWREVILPSLDRMITDIVGGKINGDWVSGKINDDSRQECLPYYVGYKQGLLDFHNHVYNYIKSIAINRSVINAIEKEKRGEFDVPLVGHIDPAMEEYHEKRREYEKRTKKKSKVKRKTKKTQAKKRPKGKK